jgi:hypothetical protein
MKSPDKALIGRQKARDRGQRTGTGGQKTRIKIKMKIKKRIKTQIRIEIKNETTTASS